MSPSPPPGAFPPGLWPPGHRCPFVWKNIRIYIKSCFIFLNVKDIERAARIYVGNKREFSSPAVVFPRARQGSSVQWDGWLHVRLF